MAQRLRAQLSLRLIATFAALLLPSLSACKSKEDVLPREPAEPAAAAAPPSVPSLPEAAPAPPPTVNLLTSVATDVAVSSVYRDDATQIAQLVDGKLDTAWNARSRELSGSWIAVRLPEATHVATLEMTAGFTATLGERDLFTGNQRVAKVRVLHNGALLGEHSLNTESRELQAIPVGRMGGVLRIEFVELRAGTRPTWLETCVSELRVMGHSDGAAEGSRWPRLRVGAMPDPETLTPDQASERVARAAAAFESAFGAIEAEVRGFMANTAEPGVPADDERRLRAARARSLVSFGEAVSLLDGAAGDRVRRLSIEDRSLRDLDTLSGALQGVLDGAPPRARCALASALVSLRLRRVADNIATLSMFDEMDEAMGGGRSGPDFSRFRDAFEGYAYEWKREPARVAAAITRSRLPARPGLSEDLDAARAQLSAHSAACGW